jgi:hypothetical protein
MSQNTARDTRGGSSAGDGDPGQQYAPSKAVSPLRSATAIQIRLWFEISVKLGDNK